GVHDFAVVDEQALQLHPDLEPDGVVPVDRDVAARFRVLGLHHLPDQPAALRDQTGEVLVARLAPDDREGNALELLDLDGVRHATSGVDATTSPARRRDA